MRRTVALAAAARPHLLAPALAAALTGWRWSAATAPDGPRCPGAPVALPLLAWCAALGAVHLTNLACDDGTDELNRKNRFHAGLLSSRTLRAAALLLAAAALVAGATVSVHVLAAVAATLALGAMYDLPPLRLARRWPGGLAVHLAGYAGIAPWLGARLAGGSVSWEACGYLGCVVAAGYLLTTTLDREGDARVGKNTWAVRFGIEATDRAAAGLLAGAAVGAMITAGGSGRVAATIAAACALALVAAAFFRPQHARRLRSAAVVGTVVAAAAPGAAACPAAAAVLATGTVLAYGLIAAAVRLAPHR